MESGQIKITKMEWDLFDVFKCTFDFSLDQKLSTFHKIFQYSVQELSSELNLDITLNRDMQQPLIHNETSTGQLKIKPSRPIKNVHLVCSHSCLLGFQSLAIDQESMQLEF